jgi:hypothetical protein
MTAAELDDVALAALAVGDVQSAVIFTVAPGSGALVLAAAAGLEGPPLDGLVAAIRDPAHPVARALTDDAPTFDVLPMNPGGPRLRSHLPLRVGGDTVGVMALAHQSATTDEQRDELIALADRAAAST